MPDGYKVPDHPGIGGGRPNAAEEAAARQMAAEGYRAGVEAVKKAVLDIDAHASALAEDEDGFVTGGYLISIGSLHRALGVVGHTAPKCQDCGGHDAHELRDANRAMWNAMQRACNHPERWNAILSEALDRFRVAASGGNAGSTS